MERIRTSTRFAITSDRQRLANLIHFETRVHRHLDWRPPLDWIGHQPFLIEEREGKLLGALACPIEPAGIAWVRLFAVASNASATEVWQSLWMEAYQLLLPEAPVKIAAIPLQSWFRALLEDSQFSHANEVVMLQWEWGGHDPGIPSFDGNPLLPECKIRPMNFDDISEVASLDGVAFKPEWSNSEVSLETAYSQASYATVVEHNHRLVGYQISTASQMGGHMARLAVHPDMQRRHVGIALVQDTLNHFVRRGIIRVTVNTQSNNQVSLSLYEKAGFRRTGEYYSVYEYQIA